MEVFAITIVVMVAIVCIVCYVKKKQNDREIYDVMHNAWQNNPENEVLKKYAPKRVSGASGSKKMLVLGSVLTVCGTISAIYGNYENNHVDAQRVYDAAQDLWYNGTVNRNPGDPFFIAGLVALGVGAVLLIGGVVWLIISKNRRDG